MCPRCRSDACVDACDAGSAHVLMCLGLEKETERCEGGRRGWRGAQRWLVGMQVRRARLSLLIPLFPFYESCLSQRVCAPWDFSSSDWEILQAVITESRCIGGLFALDETGFMFQKMSACWCIKLSVEWLGGGFLFFSFRHSNLRRINVASRWLPSTQLGANGNVSEIRTQWVLDFAIIRCLLLLL